MYFLGVDTGGTFTDLALVGDQGSFRLYKSETTPRDLSQGIMNAISLAADDLGMTVPALLQETAYFAHGTTAGTNALLQRKGCRVGLITTYGFGDTILISRLLGMTAGMSEEEVLHYSARSYPVPIVPFSLIKEVRERINYGGRIVVPLEAEDVEKAGREFAASGVEAIAVCLLWSFKNPVHEQRIKEILHELVPQVPVTLSSELIPVAGEYERTAAVVINCYLRPVIANYLSNLSTTLRENGLKSPPVIVTSNGGVLPASVAGEKAVSLLESGPAGGITASTQLGKLLGYGNIIATDMGGTSFDVGLIINNMPVSTLKTVVAKYHVNVPMIDISSIGSGGGSIARVEGGYLKVGPQSAGAEPGPACYGKGGDEPTVTDADVVLGFIDPGFFLGGRIKLDKEAAIRAVREKIAKPLGMSIFEAAAGIRTVVDNQMADLLRKVTLQRGHDPREFVLFAYGGAGPTHCANYGAELGVQRIIVPITATAQSAYGAVASDIQYTFELTDFMRTPAFFDIAAKYLDADRINRSFQSLEAQGVKALEENDIRKEDMILTRTVGMRFRRQTHELAVPVPERNLSSEDVNGLVERFESLYEDRYGRESGFREAGVELTTFGVTAVGKVKKPELTEYERGTASALTAVKGERQIYLDGRLVNVQVYDGIKTRPGNVIEGPAIIEYPGTTIVIGSGQRGIVDRYLNVEIERY